MPGRNIPIITGETYHVYNRGIHRQPTFTNKSENIRAIESIRFYKVEDPPVKLSRFLRLEDNKKAEMIQLINKKNKLIDIFAYCLMPNHFHFLIRQKKDNGIAKFIGNFQNSYTRYFNVKHDLDGSLFLDQFKAVRIETDEQLLHVSRYIHLNPFTGYLVKSLEELKNYPWSSLKEYLNEKKDIVDTGNIISMFKNKNEYQKFIFEQADYQRELKKIRHLTIE